MASDATGRSLALLGPADPSTTVVPLHPGPGNRRIDPFPWLVAAVAVGLRLATAARGPTDWDSAQYAAAVGHFDVTHGQPQPPGYWLYVETARWITGLTGAATITSLVLVAAVASAAACGLAVVAGRDLGGRWTGIAAGAVVATSPFAWFSGSIVATYSFDMLACALLIVLAWRARPGGRHGIAAVVALGLLSGFRPSMLEAFALLALIPVVACTRSWARAGSTVGAGVVAVGIWSVPMAIQQPGGFGAWLHATRAEATGALRSTSVLDHAQGGHVNLGTFVAYTVVALAPMAVVAACAGAGLAGRRLARRLRAPRREDPAGGDLVPGTAHPGPPFPVEPVAPVAERPWYQSRAAILAAAIVPPAALVALVQFAKGGYLLAYLPAAVIALLLPVAALIRVPPTVRGPRHARNPRISPTWLAVATVAVVAVSSLGIERFFADAGVLPVRWLRSGGGLWIQQPRYQAPYPDTASAIRTADTVDEALHGLGPSVDPAVDVVVFDTLDGGPDIYRNAGWELPDLRIALVAPGHVLYNEVHGALYYASGGTVAVGPFGSVYLVASPSLPGLAALTRSGEATAVPVPKPIGGYEVWRLRPGTTVTGVRIVERTGPRPLGGGI